MHAILERNRAALCERLALAARRAGRDPSDVRLVAVTKSQPPHVAAALAQIVDPWLLDAKSILRFHINCYFYFEK